MQILIVGQKLDIRQTSEHLMSWITQRHIQEEVQHIQRAAMVAQLLT